MNIKRNFRPRSNYIGSTLLLTHISKWVWTKGKGLRVHYLDGVTCKSDYTLKELLSIERPIEF